MTAFRLWWPIEPSANQATWSAEGCLITESTTRLNWASARFVPPSHSVLAQPRPRSEGERASDFQNDKQRHFSSAMYSWERNSSRMPASVGQVRLSGFLQGYESDRHQLQKTPQTRSRRSRVVRKTPPPAFPHQSSQTNQSKPKRLTTLCTLNCIGRLLDRRV